MRSTLVAAAFAAGALAVPFNEKRSYAPQGYAPQGHAPQGYAPPGHAPPGQMPQGYGNKVETALDVVYVTKVVTITADGNAPAYTPEVKHYGHKHKKPATPHQQPAPVPTPEVHYEAPPPKHEAPPKYEAPPESHPPSSPSSPKGPASGSYADTCLYEHNIHRQAHGVQELVWSDSLAATAQKIADTCVYAHDTEMDGGGYGQNIAAGIEKNNISTVITDMFYSSEEPIYSKATNDYKDDPNMSMFEQYGHYTQIVWRATTEVGCATSENCQSLANTGSDVPPYFTVCNYKSPGNYAGQYRDNVYAPKSKGPSAYVAHAEKAINKATSYKK